MQLFTSQDEELESCGILWCFYQLFGLSFWRHPFTADDLLVSKWWNATFLQICSDKDFVLFVWLSYPIWPQKTTEGSPDRYRLVDATELWAPERPDTETVSFPKQSISWTLDVKHGAHNTTIQLFIHHTHLFFSFQICTCQTLHTIVCIVYCVFAILYIAYLYICILLFSCLCRVLSFCSTVELLSL